jgi:hypothetical protein
MRVNKPRKHKAFGGILNLVGGLADDVWYLAFPHGLDLASVIDQHPGPPVDSKVFFLDLGESFFLGQWSQRYQFTNIFYEQRSF